MNAVLAWLLGCGAAILALAIFAVLLLASEVGFRLGRRLTHKIEESEQAITATLTSGMLTLLAFVLGLSINYAEGRFEARRDLVVTEANAIGTAWLRARLVADPEGGAIANGIREFAQTRLDFTRAKSEAPVEALDIRSNEEADNIWRLTEEVSRKAPTPITATLVNALNEMFDSAQAQRFAFLGQTPGPMLDMMMLGSLIAIGALGYGMGLKGSRQTVLTCLLLLMWTGAMVMAVDLNQPRVGLTHVDTRPLEWTIRDIDQAPPPAPDQ